MAVSRAQTPLCGQPWGRGGARGRPGAQARGCTAPSRSCPLTRASKMPVSIHRTPKARSCAKKVPSLRGEGCGPAEREDSAAPTPCGNQWFSGTLDPHSCPCTSWGRAGGASLCLSPTFQPQEAARPPCYSPTPFTPVPLRLSSPVLPLLRPACAYRAPRGPGDCVTGCPAEPASAPSIH